jgi:hypothetical protein
MCSFARDKCALFPAIIVYFYCIINNHDSSLAAALIDRLMFHGEVFYLSGESYRLRGKRKYLEGSAPSTGSEMEMVDCQVKTD